MRRNTGFGEEGALGRALGPEGRRNIDHRYCLTAFEPSLRS